jgi:hypothetical protein
MAHDTAFDAGHAERKRDRNSLPPSLLRDDSRSITSYSLGRHADDNSANYGGAQNFHDLALPLLTPPENTMPNPAMPV